MQYMPAKNRNSKYDYNVGTTYVTHTLNTEKIALF